MSYIKDTNEFIELKQLITPIIDWKYKIPDACAVRYFDWGEFSVKGFFCGRKLSYILTFFLDNLFFGGS